MILSVMSSPDYIWPKDTVLKAIEIINIAFMRLLQNIQGCIEANTKINKAKDK